MANSVPQNVGRRDCRPETHSFALVDDTSYLILCNDNPLTLNEQDDGDAAPSTGLTVPRQSPLIIKPVVGKTIYAWTPAAGTIVVTEAP